MTTPLIAVLASIISAAPGESAHPWLDKQEAKQRYPLKADPNSPERGPADALVTINEFSDFECPFTVQQEPILKKVLEAYPTQVKVVFKHLPLPIHANARHKAIVADCIGAQGKFWQGHDRMLAGEPEGKWSEGIDQAKLKSCVASGGTGQVDKDIAVAKKEGLAETPSFVIDGIRQGGTIGFEQFKLLIDAELAKKAAKGEGAAAVGKP